jgi:ribonucleoside-diphosphate reductase alpha chain
MRVLKRDGSLAELDLHKIHRVVEWACDGNGEIPPIKGVSISQVELQANLHLYDKIKTRDIQETLIKAAADLISEFTPNYDQVAARLVWFAVRKEAFASNKPPHLIEVIKQNIKINYSKSNAF